LNTTPTTVVLTTGLVNCCFRQNVSLPVGNWGQILLNYTGQADGGVYDSSYRMYVDQVQVLFGTTPEYGTWTVQKDLTEYTALLRGVTNLTFLLGAATIGGHFVTNLSLEFFPEPTGQAPPTVPDTFLPLWYSSSVTASRPGAYETVTVPNDVVNATLEVWTYGFGQDEFWYTLLPALRSMEISSDGKPIATVYPFPFINTGGIDLFLWRPVTAVATLNDPPQALDLTGELPLIEGTHNLSAEFTNITSGSNWLIDATLVLYTDPGIQAAQEEYFSANLSGPTLRPTATSERENATDSYTSACSIATPAGVEQVWERATAAFYVNTSTTSSGGWENITEHGLARSSTQITGPNGTFEEDRTFDAPFSVDLGSSFVQTQSNGGGYPIYGDFTSSFLNGIQVWNESTTTSGPGVEPVNRTTLIDSMSGANGTYSGQEELTAPNAGLILSVSSISSYVPRSFELDRAVGALQGRYLHEVVASGVNPTGPDNASAVTIDRQETTMAAAAGGPTRLDVGQLLHLQMIYLGGIGRVDVSWSGLPPGCVSADALDLDCHPTTPGTFAIVASATDAVGDAVRASLSPVTVVPPPSARIIPSATAVDVGSTVSFAVAPSNGSAPYLCSWWVDGTQTSAAGNCSSVLTETPTSVGSLRVNVTIVDSEGVLNRSAPASVTVVLPVSVLIEFPNGTTLGTASVGEDATVQLVAALAEGVAPFLVNWTVDGVEAGQGSMLNLSTGPTPKMLRVLAVVTDSGGGSNSSSGVLVVQAPSGTSGGGGGSGAAAYYIAAGVAVVAVIGGFAIVLSRKPRRPSSPKATRRTGSPPVVGPSPVRPDPKS
jgi:hypothetical protein